MYKHEQEIIQMDSGVARGVNGVAEATPIFQVLFNNFSQKIRVKNRIYCRLHQSQNPTYLPAYLNDCSELENV